MNSLQSDILSSLFTSLSIDELFSVLLVSKDWHEAVLYELRKRHLSEEVLSELCFNLQIKRVKLYLKYLRVSEEALRKVIATLLLNSWNTVSLQDVRGGHYLVLRDSRFIKDIPVFGTLDEEFFLRRPELTSLLRERTFRKNFNRVEIFFRGKRYLVSSSFVQKISSSPQGKFPNGDYRALLALLSEKREELNPKLRIRFRDRSLRILAIHDYFRLTSKSRKHIEKQNPQWLRYVERAIDLIKGKGSSIIISYNQEQNINLIRSSWKNEEVIASIFNAEAIDEKDL